MHMNIMHGHILYNVIYTIITYTIDECCLAIISGNVLNQTAVINETHSAEQPRDVCSIVQY